MDTEDKKRSIVDTSDATPQKRGFGVGQKGNSPDKYDYIDTLRFLAIFLIVLLHFDGECYQYFTGFSMTEIYFAKDSSAGLVLYGLTGKYALAMLCIISGFLTALKCRKRTPDVGRFIFGRYLRLMLPAMGCNLLIALLLLLRGEAFELVSYIKGSFVPGFSGVNRNLWCIGSFMIGNILLCIWYDLKGRSKNAVWLILPMLIVAVLIGDPWLFATLAGGLSFETAELLRTRRLFKEWWLLLLIPVIWWLPRGEESTLIHYRQILAAFLVMVMFRCLPFLQKVFAWKSMRILKNYSFSLFVAHGMTLFMVGTAWELVTGLGIAGYRGLFAALFLAMFVIDLLAAVVIYYLFEVLIYQRINRWLFPEEEMKTKSKISRFVA